MRVKKTVQEPVASRLRRTKKGSSIEYWILRIRHPEAPHSWQSLRYKEAEYTFLSCQKTNMPTGIGAISIG